MTSPRFEPGSFRDRDSRVLRTEGKVARFLGARGADAWRSVAATRFWQRAQTDGKVVATREAIGAPALEPGWALRLEHERIGWVSYPYEWSFGMLRDAALLHLDLLESALAEDFTLKDATPFNVLFEGSRPIFIDVGSFEPWRREPWAAYLQFCQLFLYPLLINAYADVPFQPLLRGSLEGLTPAQTSAWLPRWRDRMRPGVFRDVFLQAKLQAGTQSQDRGVRGELRQAGFGKELILHNVRRLRGIVDGLAWGRQASEWAGYAEDNSYDADGKALKERFVERALGRRPRREVLDLGANTGHYSRLAAAHAERVIAVDGDPLAVERHYRRLRAEGPANILPLVMDLANPSPGLGWRHTERASFADRARPDLTLALALLHHLSLSAHVPVPELVDWLASFGGEVVVEFVGKTDPMAQRLLRNKIDIYDDYDQAVFEREVARRFQVVERAEVPSAPRTLYSLAPRSSVGGPT